MPKVIVNTSALLKKVVVHGFFGLKAIVGIPALKKQIEHC